jgi:hypothetical protein
VIRIAAILALLGFGCAGAAERTYDLEFIAGDAVDTFPGIVARGGESACSGEVVTARIASIPQDDHALATDLIHEIAGATVARTWRIPLEAEPIGLSGDSLVVVYRRSATPVVLSITTTGELNSHAALPVPPESSYAVCPKVGLPESGYRWCVNLRDLESGANRTIAFEGPCT